MEILLRYALGKAYNGLHPRLLWRPQVPPMDSSLGSRSEASYLRGESRKGALARARVEP